MILVGRKAPNFTAPAVLGDGTMTKDFSLAALRGKPVVLFFWPLDFTFVCPSEIIAHENRRKAFEARGVQLVGVSIDSQFTHYAWRQTPVNRGGVGEVGFPMVADVSHAICRDYGIEHPEAGVALRASFLIDAEGIVRHQVVNDLPLGRDADEMLRMVDALAFHEKHGEVCPAGWKPGDAGMKADTNGVAEYLSRHAETL